MEKYSGYAQAQEVFDWISNIVPEIMQMELEESVHKEDKTIADELWHNLLLSQNDKFLNGTGIMMQQSNQYYKKLTPLFLIDKSDSIISSDNPCFTFTNGDGYNEPILVATPGLIFSLMRKDMDEPNSYRIAEMKKEGVDYYNRVIFEHGNMIISKREINVDQFEH